jgi:hypothetical protein
MHSVPYRLFSELILRPHRGFGHAVVNGFFRAVSFDWAWGSHASWSQTNLGDRATPCIKRG